ncbi:amino acid adenylation domain-containing protein [Kibdelosporangium philippinense]|uniref:Amino acid adenylation domain-containing protein n=1 Tax=Kibdelosporangium philippinense TaxID=211113 RepID=A0ABS8ZAD3_9PSEU|nr:Pls/PosA family non-ribosomal peptide synthetase [Kibdelosporangium philippinense]MCE7003641.1 amino acid adenylation domain-containing protein [Kibdelosporangium philippinense]
MRNLVVAESTSDRQARLAAPAPRTLVDIFTRTVARHPRAAALDDGVNRLTYRALADRVERSVRKLRAQGIGPGDRVGIAIPSGRSELYIGILAVLASGAAYVPADHDEPAERAELVFREAGVCAVLGSGLSLRMRPDLATPQGTRRSPRLEDDAWIIFTSGSSGTPKGVAVTHRSAAAFVDAEASLFVPDQPLGPGDRVLAGLSVGFDASCEEMWLAWRHGACLVPAPRSVVRSGADLGPWLSEREITVVSTVPTLAALWQPNLLSQVRLLIFGGEACPAELVDRLDDGRREVWNTYGPTEATVVSTATRLYASEPVRIGVPLPGWQVAVVDADGRPVEPGETGELMIGGVGLARYLDLAKDAAAYPPMPLLGWDRGYRSGDLVRAEPEGLVFVGRADSQVKIGGRRIELGEVDAALLTLPGVSAAASVVHNGMVLVGYVQLDDGAGPFDQSAAREHLAKRLPHGLTPTLAVLPELPLSPAGKVDRKALPWPLPAQPPNVEEVAPELREDLDWIAEQWRDLFGVIPVPDSDFFADGGTSLAAARLVSALRQRFPDASISDVYQHPTLLALTERLATATASTAMLEEPVAPMPRRAGFVQNAVYVLMMWIPGIRWTLAVLLGVTIVGALSGTAIPATTWVALTAGVVLLFSSAGRAVLAGLSARVLVAGLRPGEYRKGSWTHLRLWAAERFVAVIGVTGLPGTAWNVLYARLLGNTIGRDVDLHSLPPVTGLGRFGARCAIEPAVDLAGWWLDGNVLRVGTVEIGADATIGGHSTLMPGSLVGSGATVEPGTSVQGVVEATNVAAIRPPRRSRWRVAFAAAPTLSGTIMLLSLLPAVAVYTWLDLEPGELLSGLVWVVPAMGIVTLLVNVTLTAGLIRLTGRWLRVGEHPVLSKAGWSAWLIQRMMTSVRESAFALYASLATPVWLRLLGASIGPRTEASTVVGIPHMMSVGSGSFLADNTTVAPYRLSGGWLRIGKATVADQAFVGNSAEVAPGREVQSSSLIGVLSQAPETSSPGTSWLGRPEIEIPRRADQVDAARTYQPSRRLVVQRVLVELTRLVPLALSATLGYLVFAVLEAVAATYGIVAVIVVSGPVLLGAGAIATVLAIGAKWLLNRKIRAAEHPLWSAFVWRNELVAVYFEELTTRWLGPGLLGTPLYNAVLRANGAKIGRGVYCETKWLPEPDLVTAGDGVVVNRGCVVQTHLFQDRILRLGQVRLDSGTTLGPHTVALLDTRLGKDCSIGANSLVMRGEAIPARRRFEGNPVAPAA